MIKATNNVQTSDMACDAIMPVKPNNLEARNKQGAQIIPWRAMDRIKAGIPLPSD